MESPTAAPPPVQIKLLTLAFAPALGAIDARPLETFLADKEVLALREHFFAVQGLPHLACLITYRLPRGRGEPARAVVAECPRRERIVLDEHELARFETLRTWRAERARRDGVPPYVVFTNRELAAVVRTRPGTANELSALPGIGPGKVERYGAEVLARLRTGDDAVAAEPADTEATA